MRVNVDEIKEVGLQRSFDLPREQVDGFVRDDQAGYRARGAAHVDASFRRLDRRVLLAARGVAPLTVSCGRCLTATSVDVPLEFDLTFVPATVRTVAADERDEGDGKGHVGGSFDPDEAEEETYEGKVIDLDPVVREQLILALPEYPVCKDGCKGLCPVCGGNLNDRECGCDRHVPDPRWAGLKNVKLQ